MTAKSSKSLIWRPDVNEQMVCVVTISNDMKNYERKEATAEINEQLDEGWRIVAITPASTGQITVFFVTLERKVDGT